MPLVEAQMNTSEVEDEAVAVMHINGRAGPAGANKGLSIPDRVALLYYKHGLLCSSYPWWAIAVAIAIVLTSCHPLLTMPFPGNEPEEISLPSGPPADYPSRWRARRPAFYIQQIMIRSTVHPWTSELGLMDAFRGPLGEVFRVHSEVVSFHSARTNKTLRDVCQYVEESAVTAGVHLKQLLPEFGCLVLSPANLWRLDETVFRDDPAFLDTVFSYRNPVVEVRSSMADLFFGIPLKDTGLKRYPVKTRSRVLTYAVTVVLRSQPEPDVIDDLKTRLYGRFPLHASDHHQQEADEDQVVVHMFYPERFNYLELIPLVVVYVALFVYVYFSVRKMEMVKSKLGMAVSAVATVAASLGMSVGLCAWFGLRLTLHGRADVFPYLVVIIGLENILVLTRSVVSTPANLDVKIRVAQGLSREGWNITKNLLAEVTILTVGFFTFVPAIQEFCLFAVVALLSDFFLQMLFFTTVLSIDILRMELSEIQRHRRQLQPGQQYNQPRPPLAMAAGGDSGGAAEAAVQQLPHPHLRGRRGRLAAAPPPQAVVAPSSYTHYHMTQQSIKVPRRIRVVHFWARTRLFQRTFMVGVVVWMGLFVYKYVVVERFSFPADGWPANAINVTSIPSPPAYPAAAEVDRLPDDVSTVVSPPTSSTSPSSVGADVPPVVAEVSDPLGRLQHPKNVQLWRRLSYRHWPDLLALYNYSLAGTCIALLPPIRLSIAVGTERLADVRNARDGEYLSQRWRWTSLATAALDSLDVLDGEDSDFEHPRKQKPGSDGASYVPSSPVEIALTILLAIPSVAFIGYVMVVLYRCICSRHYAEWRSSGSSSFWWWPAPGNAAATLAQESRDYYAQIVAESMPLVLDGHRSPVECVATDGDVVSSVCLAGQLHIWDIQTGDPTAQIDRNVYFESLRQQYQQHQHQPQPPPCAPSPVWCMQCFDGLVSLGCANGRIEIWAATGQQLRCFYDDGSGAGIAKLKVCGQFLLAARLNGALESFQLGPNGSSLKRLNWARAHQQPISVLEAEAGRVVTGSQDHCIKVWRLESLTAMYSLHGHCGPITALFIDGAFPCSTAASGSQDGMLCLWDLASGTCVYSLQAHDGSVSVLTYTSSYVISLGTDDRLCVWERFQGHLLNTLVMTRLSCGSLAVLSDRLLVTSRQGSLVVWDVRTGESIRQVQLGDADASTFVRHVLVVRDSVICDYGSQLRIVAFPMIATQKVE